MDAIATISLPPADVRSLLLAAAPGEPTAALLTLAGVMSLAPQRRGIYRMPIVGIKADELVELVRSRFPAARALLPTLLAWHEEWRSVARQPLVELDEFDDLLCLLVAHQSSCGRESRWLACAIATAAMADRHLWQDLGLANRGVLNELMQTHFTALKLKNSGDMKWKKFFYRQLCERAEVPICKSPNCAQCCDYLVCFGAED